MFSMRTDTVSVSNITGDCFSGWLAVFIYDIKILHNNFTVNSSRFFVAVASRLIDQLADHMLNRQLQTVDPRKGVRQLLLEICLIIGKLSDEIRTDFQLLVIIFHNAYPPEHNDAIDIERPFAVPSEALVHFTIADLVIGGDGIDLVAYLRAVEIELVIRIPVVERNAVGVPFVTDHGEHAARLLLQNPDAFFLANLLLESSHFSEHSYCPPMTAISVTL